MRMRPLISIVIPALNEEESIGQVLGAIPPDTADEILVVDGGSRDRTVEVARTHRARIVEESRRGYGRACAAGVAAAQGDVVAFLDADGADNPVQLPDVLAPILAGNVDLSLGSRLAGEVEPGAMPWHQRFGNRLAAWLIRLLYGLPVTDLSPFRAVRRELLFSLDMREMTYGWPTEMLVKAARRGWRVVEVPVRYRQRLGGRSKISGTVRGTMGATYHILTIIFRHSRWTVPDSPVDHISSVKPEILRPAQYGTLALCHSEEQCDEESRAELVSDVLHCVQHDVDTALVIMAKQPLPGQTKTRLCPPLTPDEAAALSEAMLQDTIALVTTLPDFRLAIAVTPPESLGYFRRISPPDTLLLPISGVDIGDCLNQALTGLLEAGHSRALAFNSDGPTLPVAHLRQAVSLLDGADVVIGPSEDGGYYLIGLKQPQPSLFHDIRWSSEEVTAQTLARAESLGLKVAMLSTWYDVDTAADLARLRVELETLLPEAVPHTRHFFTTRHSPGQ